MLVSDIQDFSQLEALLHKLSTQEQYRQLDSGVKQRFTTQVQEGLLYKLASKTLDELYPKVPESQRKQLRRKAKKDAQPSEDEHTIDIPSDT